MNYILGAGKLHFHKARRKRESPAWRRGFFMGTTDGFKELGRGVRYWPSCRKVFY